MNRIARAIRRTPLLAGLPKEVAVLTAIAFCVALGFGILAPSLPIFARTFDVSALQVSAVISVFALMRFVSAPGAGALTDRFGERVVMSSGLAIVGLSSLAAGFSQSLLQLIVLRGVGGIGSSMFTVSAMALLLRVVDTEQRGRAAAAFQGGFLFGGVAGPAVGESSWRGRSAHPSSSTQVPCSSQPWWQSSTCRVHTCGSASTRSPTATRTG